LINDEEKAKWELIEILRQNPDYSIRQYTTPNLYSDKKTMKNGLSHFAK